MDKEENIRKNTINFVGAAIGFMVLIAGTYTDLIRSPDMFSNFEDLVIIMLGLQLLLSSLRSHAS